MTLFENIAIEDFAEVTSSKRIFLNDYVENGIPFWRSKEVIEQFKRAEISNELFITEEKYYNIKNKFGVPACGDILITSVGTIGVPFLVKDESPFYFKDGNLTWIKNIDDSVDSKYLYFWISSQIGQQTIDNQLIGSSQKALTIAALKKIKIPIPSLPTQKKIAKILSNYDDLIENNLNRIKLLEEYARLTYEEWFLRFRIDGKKLEIDSTTGLPFGWEWQPFKKIIDFKEGPGIRNWQYKESGIPFLNIRVIKDGDVDMSKIQYLDTEEVNEKYQHFLLQVNDHVISSSGTLGRLTTIRSCHLPLCLNTSIIRMRKISDNFGTWLIKHMLKGQIFQNIMDTYANGSAQVNFGPTHLKQIKLQCPSKDIAIKYESIMSPIEEESKILRDQNQLLEETRDILLPRLMTGMIDTDDMDIAI